MVVLGADIVQFCKEVLIQDVLCVCGAERCARSGHVEGSLGCGGVRLSMTQFKVKAFWNCPSGNAISLEAITYIGVHQPAPHRPRETESPQYLPGSK